MLKCLVRKSTQVTLWSVFSPWSIALAFYKTLSCEQLYKPVGWRLTSMDQSFKLPNLAILLPKIYTNQPTYRETFHSHHL